jgi:signal transduction protein with GAF and PtsI domain
MRWLKLLGIAGLIGAAAVGVVVVQRRQARTWTELEPDELRDRLHARLAGASDGAPVDGDGLSDQTRRSPHGVV